jgi:hypothetical protein
VEVADREIADAAVEDEMLELPCYFVEALIHVLESAAA